MERTDMIGLSHELNSWERRELKESGVQKIEPLRRGDALRTRSAVIRPVWPHTYILSRELPEDESGAVASNMWFSDQLLQIFEPPFGHIPLWEFQRVRIMTVFTDRPLDWLDRQMLLRDLQVALRGGAERVFSVKMNAYDLATVLLSAGVMGRVYPTAVQYCCPRDALISCFFGSSQVKFLVPGQIGS